MALGMLHPDDYLDLANIVQVLNLPETRRASSFEVVVAELSQKVGKSELWWRQRVIAPTAHAKRQLLGQLTKQRLTDTLDVLKEHGMVCAHSNYMHLRKNEIADMIIDALRQCSQSSSREQRPQHLTGLPVEPSVPARSIMIHPPITEDLPVKPHNVSLSDIFYKSRKSWTFRTESLPVSCGQFPNDVRTDLISGKCALHISFSPDAHVEAFDFSDVFARLHVNRQGVVPMGKKKILRPTKAVDAPVTPPAHLVPNVELAQWLMRDSYVVLGWNHYGPTLINGTLRVNVVDAVPWTADHFAAQTPRISSSHVKRMQEEAAAEDDDCLIDDTEEMISINDPVTCGRIKIPARGVQCKHRQCFDFESFVNLSRQSCVWACPICWKPLPLEDLRIDELFATYLLKIPGGCTRGRLTRGGMSVEPELSQEEKQRLVVKREDEQKVSIDTKSDDGSVIDLMSDSDDSDAGESSGAKRPADDGDLSADDSDIVPPPSKKSAQRRKVMRDVTPEMDDPEVDRACTALADIEDFL